MKTRHDGDFADGQSFMQAFGRKVGDAGAAMGAGGGKRQLPSLPGTRGQAFGLQGQGKKPGGLCFAGRKDGILFLRIFWGWNGGGEWIAPTGRKYALNWYPALFKLYAIRQISNQDQNLAVDPINDFLRQFLPVVDPILFPSSTPSAAPTAPDQLAPSEKAA